MTWKRTRSALMLIVLALPMLIALLYRMIVRRRSFTGLVAMKPLLNKQRLATQNLPRKGGSGDCHDPSSISAIVSKSIGSPTHTLDFYEKDEEEDNTESTSDFVDAARWEPNRMPGTDWSRALGADCSTESNVLPKNKLEFTQAMSTVTSVLQQATRVVADRHELPLEELYVVFDEWPFEEGIVGVKHSRYDETGLPCHDYYRVELDELLPETEPAGFEFPRLDCTARVVTEFLHNTLVRSTTSNHPHVALADRSQIIFDEEDRNLSYYVTAKQWSDGVAVQIQSLVHTGVLILTADAGPTTPVHAFLIHTKIRCAPNKKPPIALPGNIVRVTEDDQPLAVYFDETTWTHGVARQIEALVSAGALIMTSNYVDPQQST
ncbi:hypothetical protein LCGC14_0698740 [marine sediment metagenome]|uniref:Uncharacterized protein n=1 Tax=marine sediment metagenome TaxID=412755 RepID=A0A0F9QIF5_9ZZZZ